EAARLMLRVMRHALEMPHRVRSEEAAVRAPMAIELPSGQRAQVRHRVETLAADSKGEFGAVFGRQRAERRLDAVSDLAAVAARASGADDEHIDLFRQRLCGSRRIRRGVGPQRSGANRVGHHAALCACGGMPRVASHEPSRMSTNAMRPPTPSRSCSSNTPINAAMAGLM